MASPNESALLYHFLFNLRTPLYAIKGASQVAKHRSENIPVPLLQWLDKWEPLVERWISAEEKAHTFLRDGAEHDWKQIVYEMADAMKDVSTALAEGQALEIPETREGEMIFNLTLCGGFKYLNEIVQPILNRDFQHLLNL